MNYRENEYNMFFKPKIASQISSEGITRVNQEKKLTKASFRRYNVGDKKVKTRLRYCNNLFIYLVILKIRG